MSGVLGTNAEFEQLKNKCRLLKSELGALLADRDVLLTTVRHNIEREYHLRLGDLQLRRLELEIEVLRLRRHLALQQAALNAGRRPHPDEIKEQLDKEFAEWRVKLDAEVRRLEQSREDTKNLHSVEYSIKLTAAYRALAKRLHPDANPNQSEHCLNLWYQARAAYEAADLDNLEMLLALLADEEEVLVPEDGDAFMRLHEVGEQLAARIHALIDELAATRAKNPWSLAEKITDPHWVAQQRACLETIIRSFESQKAGLLVVLKEWSGEAPDA